MTPASRRKLTDEGHSHVVDPNADSQQAEGVEHTETVRSSPADTAADHTIAARMLEADRTAAEQAHSVEDVDTCCHS